MFRIKWDDVTVELLAADYDVEPEDLIAIVEYAVKIGLLEIGDGFIFSAEHRNGLKPLLLKRERDLLFLDNKAKSKTDAGGAEIIDAENEPKTSENRAGGSLRRRKQAETGFFVNYRRISFF